MMALDEMSEELSSSSQDKKIINGNPSSRCWDIPIYNNTGKLVLALDKSSEAHQSLYNTLQHNFTK